MKSIVRKDIEKDPKIAILTLVLLVTLVIAFIGAIIRHNWVLMILTIVIAVLICLPKFVGRWSHITIPEKLEVYIILFFYATLFLGELKNYYATYWWWDVAIHTSSGLAFGIIGFIILYVLQKAEKIKTSPKTIAFFAFAFGLAIGAVWEIVEFTIDSTFGPISNNVPMQGGLGDTMGDLIVDALGALFSAVMGYFYLKHDSGIIVKPMVKEFKKDNPRLFKKRNL